MEGEGLFPVCQALKLGSVQPHGRSLARGGARSNFPLETGVRVMPFSQGRTQAPMVVDPVSGQRSRSRRAD